jgi:hypothetical protein
LPPDNNRWRLSGLPPPASPPAEQSPERPSGWAKFDPLSSPPGISIIDAMVEADTRRQREDAIAAEVQRRQAILDAHAEQKLFEKELARAEAERRSFHRGPGDSDWDSK